MVNTSSVQSRQSSHQDPDFISPLWSLFNIGAIVFLLVLFNVFPHRIGVILSGTDPDSFVPLISARFQHVLPWLNAWWGMTLTLYFVHLGLRRWIPLTRWADLALTLVGAAILLALLTGPSLIDISAASAAAGEPVLQVQQSLVPVVRMAIKIALGLALVGTVIAALQKLLRLVGAWLAGESVGRTGVQSKPRTEGRLLGQPPGAGDESPNYLGVGMAYGMIIGVALGLVFGIVLGNMAFMGVGIGAGLPIGLAIGSRLEEQGKS